MKDETYMGNNTAEEEVFSKPFCMDYFGKGIHFEVAVVKPTDERSGGVCLPHFLGAGEHEKKKWFEESSYTSVELLLPEKEKTERLKEFLSMGLPHILAVYAAYGDFDIEEVRQKLPDKKVPIIGLGSYYSGRGKSMLGALVSHLRPDVGVINGGLSSGNTAHRYAEAISGLPKTIEGFDYSVAVDQMKLSALKDIGERTDTVKDVLGRIWDAWFENKDKEMLLVDLPGRSEIANYSANSFGLLRFGMATFEVIREFEEDGEAISAAVEISSDELESQFSDFNKYFNRVLVENILLGKEFTVAVNSNEHNSIPNRILENSKRMSKV